MMSVNVIILQVVGWKKVNNRSLSLSTNSLSRHMPPERCLHAENNQSLQHMALTIGRTWVWCLWIWNVWWNAFGTDSFSYYVKNVWTAWLNIWYRIEQLMMVFSVKKSLMAVCMEMPLVATSLKYGVILWLLYYFLWSVEVRIHCTAIALLARFHRTGSVQYGTQLFPFPLLEVVNGTKIANRTTFLVPFRWGI